MTQASPQSIRRIDQGRIEIAWSDGATGVYSPRLLREACPCATCREKRAEPAPPALPVPPAPRASPANPVPPAPSGLRVKRALLVPPVLLVL